MVVTGVRVHQVGGTLAVWFRQPTTHDDGTPLEPDARLEVMLATEVPAGGGRAIENSPALAWSIPASKWPLYEMDGGLEVPLSLDGIAKGLGLEGGAGSLKGRSLSFIVQVVEGKRRRSPVSRVRTHGVCVPPPAPALSSGRLREEGLHILWPAPLSGGGEEPDGRFNIYRRPAGGKHTGVPLNESPLNRRDYFDGTAAENVPYFYTVRSVGEPGCESEDGPVVEATYADLFPPERPEGLAAVAEQGSIRLFWRPNREQDLRGYRVYRAEGTSGAPRLVSPDLLTTTTFTDGDAASGVVYSYAVTALDDAVPPNESVYSAWAVESLDGDS